MKKYKFSISLLVLCSALLSLNSGCSGNSSSSGTSPRNIAPEQNENPPVDETATSEVRLQSGRKPTSQFGTSRKLIVDGTHFQLRSLLQLYLNEKREGYAIEFVQLYDGTHFYEATQRIRVQKKTADKYALTVDQGLSYKSLNSRLNGIFAAESRYLKQRNDLAFNSSILVGWLAQARKLWIDRCKAPTSLNFEGQYHWDRSQNWINGDLKLAFIFPNATASGEFFDKNFVVFQLQLRPTSILWLSQRHVTEEVPSTALGNIELNRVTSTPALWADRKAAIENGVNKVRRPDDSENLTVTQDFEKFSAVCQKIYEKLSGIKASGNASYRHFYPPQNFELELKAEKSFGPNLTAIDALRKWGLSFPDAPFRKFRPVEPFPLKTIPAIENLTKEDHQKLIDNGIQPRPLKEYLP